MINKPALLIRFPGIVTLSLTFTHLFGSDKKLLKSITKDPAKPLYKDACWYTGLALIKLGAINEAIPYLERSSRPESSELINKLK